MKFTPGDVDGVWEIELQRIEDERGFFARAWCEDDFAAQGLVAGWKQSNIQFSPHVGTLRGIHYQVPPHSEVKLVRCTSGVAWDVAIDVRPASPTFGEYSVTELSASLHNAVWVPEGFAHAYITLEPDTEVFYLTSNFYVPEAVRAVRPDDPVASVDWPRPIEVYPPGWENWPDLDPETGG